MTKEELIALADKHQEKADKAYKNYQEPGFLVMDGLPEQ